MLFYVYTRVIFNLACYWIFTMTYKHKRLDIKALMADLKRVYVAVDEEHRSCGARPF